MKNEQDLEKIEMRFLASFGCAMESKTHTLSSKSNPGKYSLTLHILDHISWASVVVMCREEGVDPPTDMFVEKPTGKGYCSVTIFWGFEG